MYLGIDIGTSGVKVVLMDEDQNVINSSVIKLQLSKLGSGWFEQKPIEWVLACKKAIQELRILNRNEVEAVRAIGLSGQMHGATLLDNAGKVLRPCILWNDTRSHQEARELDSIARFKEITGNIVFPGFTAPKLLWIKRHEPELFRKISMVLLPKDYIRYWLTGEFVTDMSDASGTSWLNMIKRKWSPELLAHCELSEKNVPHLVEGSEESGVVRPRIASELGFSGKVVVAGGAGDNAASAIATGTVKSGSAFLSLGTSGTVFASNSKFKPNHDSAIHAFCHAIPDSWHQMGVILSATAALSWYARIVGAKAQDLTAALGEKLHAPSDALFLPYIVGERTPHNDAEVRGAFFGLGAEMDRNQLTQAVLEGVSFALCDNLEALRETGTTPEEVTAVGGGVNSIYWLKSISTALGIPVIVPEKGDIGAAFGAARLAMLADCKGNVSEICSPLKTRYVVEPDQKLKAQYDEAYERYRAAYDKLKMDGATSISAEQNSSEAIPETEIMSEVR